MAENNNISQYIKDHLRRFEISQTKLAELSGVSNQSISCIVNGHTTKPHSRTRAKLVKALKFLREGANIDNKPINGREDDNRDFYDIYNMSEYIREKLDELKINLRQFSQISGIDYSIVRRLMDRKTLSPHHKTIKRVVDGFNSIQSKKITYRLTHPRQTSSTTPQTIPNVSNEVRAGDVRLYDLAELVDYYRGNTRITSDKVFRNHVGSRVDLAIRMPFQRDMVEGGNIIFATKIEYDIEGLSKRDVNPNEFPRLSKGARILVISQSRVDIWRIDQLSDRSYASNLAIYLIKGIYKELDV